MRTNTEHYVMGHGKKPRGIGCWTFNITGTDGNGSYLTESVMEHGIFGEAKKMAVRNFKNSSGRIKSIVEVVVLP